MDGYIVRVIRRDQADRGKCLHMKGVVEGVEVRGRRAFHSATELWAIPAGACRVKASDRGTTTGIRRSIRFAVLAAVCALWIAACGRSNDPARALAAVDACSLLSNAEVHALAPQLSAGHTGKVTVANTFTCEWDDAHHLPGLMLQVSPADPAGVKKELEEGFANLGYDVRSVAGLGDEAAVAVQRADPARGLDAGVAELALRVGKRQLLLSPAYLNIAPATAGFKHLKALAEQAAARLRAREAGNAP